MLGKAVYEGILLELPLAGFFLKKFSGCAADLGDLASLDPEVHRHLLALRHYKGEARRCGSGPVAGLSGGACSKWRSRRAGGGGLMWHALRTSPRRRDASLTPDRLPVAQATLPSWG